jgi:hypothetical protein
LSSQTISKRVMLFSSSVGEIPSNLTGSQVIF